MQQSEQLFALAQQYIPGGVNSPVRAFKAVDSQPIFIQKGQGAHLVDVDGKRYIDYVGSWGPLILGHAHPVVLEKVQSMLQNGFSFGAPTEIEVKLAQKVCEIIPSIERIRFVNSGTEATMSAIRLARGYTKRNKFIKFVGCYHGHADSLLVAAGSGVLTLGIPSSAGVPPKVAEDTLLADFNNLDEVKQLFEKYGNDIAGVIVEPIAGNMNCVLPLPGFLSGLRKLCDKYGSLLIFDEVMTGFRVALGGAQALYNIKPDLTVLGKIIGGGFPVGAFGGRADVMSAIAPLGPVYQAGTLSGNPIAMSCGLATLEVITGNEYFYATLADKTERLVTGLKQLANAVHTPFQAHHIGSMFGIFFTEGLHLANEADVKQSNVSTFKKFFRDMLDEGVYLAPSAFEAGFVSAAHTNDDIEHTLQAAEKVFAKL